MSIHIKVGSRSSKLALAQVHEVFSLLRENAPEVHYELYPFSTKGDLDKTTSLTDPKISDDFFTDALDDALLRHDIDVAIHSAKDLPKRLKHGVILFALTEGLEDSDSLVSRFFFDELPIGATIGTSSTLRQKEIRKRRPDLTVLDIRGTIQERLDIVASHTMDAVVVATCALKRLNLTASIKQILPWPGMPLQGQLAITGRATDERLRTLFSVLDVRRHYGKVTLVGAGPGDQGLITVKGIQTLAKADCVVYDYLVEEGLLRHAPGAEFICAGKRKGAHSISQDDLNVLLKKKAVAGKNVVRLKGGDPFIFGRGYDEVAFLREYHIPVHVVPGVSSATGIPSQLGIPLTARGLSSSVAFVSGYGGQLEENIFHIPQAQTLVFLMALTKVDLIVTTLLKQGWLGKTPMVVIGQGTKENQHVIKSTLDEIQAKINDAPVHPPALMIVGKTVGLFEEPLPKVYLHCGTHPELYQGSFTIVPWPMIDIIPITLTKPQIQELCVSLDKADIIVWTSRFAVDNFFKCLGENRNVQKIQQKILVVIGQETAVALQSFGLRADIQPVLETAQGLFAQMKKVMSLKGKKILFPRSKLSNPFLKDALVKELADVTEVHVYDNIKPPYRELPRMTLDGVIFTSPSTVRHFCEDYGKIPKYWDIIAKGDVTAQEIKKRGYICRIVSEG